MTAKEKEWIEEFMEKKKPILEKKGFSFEINLEYGRITFRTPKSKDATITMNISEFIKVVDDALFK